MGRHKVVYSSQSKSRSISAKRSLITTASRSYNMSRIKSKNTKSEVLFRKALWAKNIRFRIHAKGLPGKPDIVIKKYKLAIFIDGEFWHGYQWDSTKNKIKSNREFWISKIENNIRRDIANNNSLTEMGYTIFRFWSKDINKNLNACINQVLLYVETAREIKIPQKDRIL